MSSTDFEQISAAADHLAINPLRGKYHKPVALVWAIDRAVQGLPRLATAATVRLQLDPLLRELSGVDSNAAWPWLKLANDLGSAWVVDGADPSADPPRHFVAGWSRSSYLAMAEDPKAARGLIETVVDAYLGDVGERVADALGMIRETDVDTVIVAAGIAYDEYLTYAAYICQPGRSFRPVERLGFYRDKRIEPLVPEVLGRLDHVTIDESTSRELALSASSSERAIGLVVERLVADGSSRVGNTEQIFLLSDPRDARTLDLGAPVPHDGASAWTQNQRYASSDVLKEAQSTEDV